jgi:hypothetical protein
MANNPIRCAEQNPEQRKHGKCARDVLLALLLTVAPVGSTNRGYEAIAHSQIGELQE